MCLVTLQKRVKIAKTDIPVFKILEKHGNGGFRSPYQGMRYKLGKLYQAEIRSSATGMYCSGSDRVAYQHEKNKIFYNRGLHAYTTIDAARYGKYSGMYIMNAVIPAGSRYYVNKVGMVVSNQLKVIGKI
jgi:hypothetical protein